MKRFSFTAALVTCCMAGSFAQAAEQDIKHLRPIEKKALNLEYLGNDSSSVLERIYHTGQTSSYLQNQELNDSQEKAEQLKPELPVMQPDPSIEFHMLAAKPAATLFHLQVKKPE